MTAIVVERLTKTYGGLNALDDVSFEVPAGQPVAVLGPNGAGRTTLVETLEGFLEPSSGSVRVLGADPRSGDRRWRARVGFVLQSTSLDPEPTVRDLLTLFARLYPAPRPVAEVLAMIDLAAEAGARIGLVAAREAGVLKRWHATPLPRWCYFAGGVAATVVLATMAGAVTVGVAAALFGTPIGPSTVLEFLAVFAVGALACAATCTAVTGLAPNVASAFPVLGLTYLPVLLISGALGSSTAVPAWLVRVTDFLPIRPTAEAAADALQGQGVPVVPVAVLACWVAIGLLAALVTFRWEPTRTRQKRPDRT
jgi:ABC-type Fe3+/spermidine/putrescine transport system ATPase subunit